MLERRSRKTHGACVQHHSSIWPSSVRRGDAALRLDIALVHRLGVELALDDHVGLGEAGLDVADAELERSTTLVGLSASLTPLVRM